MGTSQSRKLTRATDSHPASWSNDIKYGVFLDPNDGVGREIKALEELDL
jgi:hypothetical protein